MQLAISSGPVSTKLGPIGSKFSPPRQKRAPKTADNVKVDRRLRYQMRRVAQALTSSKGVQKCGRAPVGIGETGSVSLRYHRDTGRAYYAGLQRCSNPWQCPVCVVRIQHGRCQELKQLDAAHRRARGGLVMATLTFPHDLGNDLKRLRKTATKAWSSCIAGAPWQRQQQALGILGYVRALESTEGPNGWHQHIHAVLYLQRPVSPERLATFQAWLLDRWRKAIVRRGYRRPSEEHGVTVEPCRDASYIAKMGLAAELTLSGTKQARPGHRTAMQILRDITLGKNRVMKAMDAAKFREWCDAMHGARQLTWSAGVKRLADWYKVNLTDDDADVPDPPPELPFPERAEPAPASDIVYEFEPDEWRFIRLSRQSVALRLALLEAAERHTTEYERADAVVKLLQLAQGIDPPPF